jgi:hypothetical protein
MKRVRTISRVDDHCQELGEYIRETRTQYFYRPTGASIIAFISKKLAHVEPCSKCRKPPQAPENASSAPPRPAGLSI